VTPVRLIEIGPGLPRLPTPPSDVHTHFDDEPLVRVGVVDEDEDEGEGNDDGMNWMGWYVWMRVFDRDPQSSF
jgi:hypothetical protein